MSRPRKSSSGRVIKFQGFSGEQAWAQVEPSGKIHQCYPLDKFFTFDFHETDRRGIGAFSIRTPGGLPLNYKPWLAVFASANLLLPSLSFGHARLSVTAAGNTIPRLIPRNSSDGNKGDAASPCGPAITRSANPVVLVVGETVTAEFEETIGHVGTFQLNFSQTGQVNFTTLAPAQTDDNTAVGAVPNKGQFQFTVPNTPCTDCTIQFVQDMGGTLHYKSCVDVIITPANAPAPAQPSGFAVTK
ncbi:SCE4755 family polysaccharide monooxygenase-like protein [Oligoflexus tunisiensis]|uniref:SCE4755 family polysaccharide monooxygenase-like protein n=1 Tax=Oligoflexus tunisiensis TaxID=708132 RepID=UPI00114CDC43|nr:SCE4755 family polysaccharide monooxygenase-like protein [Oligoflexus tunisiensis]